MTAKPQANLRVEVVGGAWDIELVVKDATNFIDIQAIVGIRTEEPRFWSYTNALDWVPVFPQGPIPPTDLLADGLVEIDDLQWGEEVTFKVYQSGIRKALKTVRVELPAS